MYHFFIVKKIGLNFLLRNHFCFAVLRPGTEPCDYEAVSRNSPPIIFCARFEFTWFRDLVLNRLNNRAP